METTGVHFEFTQLEIPDVIVVRAIPFADERGVFVESYRRSSFVEHGIAPQFVQDNHSHSTRGVLRGLHYQDPPEAQAKLVFVVRGEIFDVAVDIRKGSPTYARWVGLRMSADEPRTLYIPEGFAHGFQVLSNEADVVYKVTREYSAEADRGIAWDDPALNITWPIHPAVLSAKDARHRRLAEVEIPFTYNGKVS
jgi:dTDP-4-dehydrorhamnose 3,5-epimerase